MAELFSPCSYLDQVETNSRNINVVDSSGVAGTVDTLWGTNCIRIAGTATVGAGTVSNPLESAFIETPVFIGGGTTTTYCTHHDEYMVGLADDFADSTSWYVWLALFNSSLSPVIRVLWFSDDYTSTIGFYVYQWTGAAWAQIGNIFYMPIAALKRVDTELICGSGGTFKIKVGGAVVFYATGISASVNDIKYSRIYNPNKIAANYLYVSQWQGADYPVQDGRQMFYTLNAVASGFYTAGSGSASDLTDNSDGTLWSLTAAGGRGFTVNALTPPSGYVPIAASFSGRFALTGPTLTDGFVGLRSAGADNLSASIGATTTIQARQQLVKTIGGSPITLGGANGSEFFLKAA